MCQHTWANGTLSWWNQALDVKCMYQSHNLYNDSVWRCNHWKVRMLDELIGWINVPRKETEALSVHVRMQGEKEGPHLGNQLVLVRNVFLLFHLPCVWHFIIGGQIREQWNITMLPKNVIYTVIWNKALLRKKTAKNSKSATLRHKGKRTVGIQYGPFCRKTKLHENKGERFLKISVPSMVAKSDKDWQEMYSLLVPTTVVSMLINVRLHAGMLNLRPLSSH